MHNNAFRLPGDTIITSILLALFACAKFLNLIVLSAYPSLAGKFMTAMYIVVLSLLLYTGLIRQRRNILRLAPSHILILLLCVLWYLFTYIFVDIPSVSFPFFFIFTLSSFIIPGIVYFNARIFLLTLMIIPSIGVLYLDQLMLNLVLESGTFSLGASYAILIPVIANLVYVKFYYMKESFCIKILLLPFMGVNLYYLVQMAVLGSRGPMLCVVLLLASLLLVKVDKNSAITIRTGRAFIFICFAVIIALAFKPFLIMLSNFLASFDVTLNVVDKFLIMDGYGDMTNGRKVISDITWEAISRSPFWGYGIAQFENNTGIIYPHNFVLQFIYDGGFIMASCVMIPIIVAINRKIRVLQLDNIACLLFFAFASVPGALFSGDLWQSSMLWMFFGYVLSRNSLLIS